MVSVSRAVVAPSGFRVCVAESGELIPKSSEAAEVCLFFLTTLHPKGAGRKPPRGRASNFGTLAGGSFRQPYFAGDYPLEQARLAIAAYFRSPNLPARAHLPDPLWWWKIQVENQNEATTPLSTGIGDNRQGQGEEEKAAQIDSRADGM